MDLQQAYAFCRRRAFGHYENFPVASWLLPQPQRNAIAALYAFARQADDYADEPGVGTPRQRLALLARWRLGLRRPGSHPALLAVADARRRFAIPEQPFRDLIFAFSQDCRKHRYLNFQQVLGYCRCSANPVGRVVLRIFGCDSPEALPLSDAVCTALQLANFWQDLASDAKQRDRIYLPQDELRRFRVQESELRQGCFSDRLRALMRFQIQRSETFFFQGEALLRHLPRRLRLEVGLTLLGGRRILEKIRSQGYDTLSKRPALGWTDALPLLWRFLRK